MTSRSELRRLAVALAELEREGALRPPAQPQDLPVRLERAVRHSIQHVHDAGERLGRLTAALDEVAQGVVVCDGNGRVIHRNRAATAFVGARHGDALAERTLEELLRAARRGGEHTETLELFGPPRRTLTITAKPLRDGSGLVGAVALVDDVSERKRLNAVRRDFVANISHELKTPVGALSLVAEALEGEDDLEVVRRLSQRMQTEAMRLARIIDDLLELSRIEDGGEPLMLPVVVADVLDEAVERVRPLAEHRAITVEVTEPVMPLIVSGDHRQLVSAVHNLLDNAVKYSDPGSTVELAAERRAGALAVAVRDHGIGIPPRDLDRIFERFYRVDRARARDTGGTGLGLSIVRHVAENHSGRVDVES
ncbi:MAG: two-component system, OmpR family, sensor histidine kinase SenX3, partial [Acidimicrobiaceae bacterium]|nr:two-component system, OmpR family, sensor histidine kinase SenX3 [Acidimicrobiaceae bacterium]